MAKVLSSPSWSTSPSEISQFTPAGVLTDVFAEMRTDPQRYESLSSKEAFIKPKIPIYLWHTLESLGESSRMIALCGKQVPVSLLLGFCLDHGCQAISRDTSVCALKTMRRGFRIVSPDTNVTVFHLQQQWARRTDVSVIDSRGLESETRVVRVNAEIRNKYYACSADLGTMGWVVCTLACCLGLVSQELEGIVHPDDLALHHSRANGHYMLYFNLWDRLMGTNHPDYHATFEALAESSRGEAGSTKLSRSLPA